VTSGNAGLGHLAWPDVPAGATVLVPVGSTEQHGPHLPLNTDTVIADAVAGAAAERLTGSGHTVVVAPAFAHGASGEHAGFPGTISLGHEALRFLLVEAVRSLSLWAGRTVFVNGHGGNAPTLGAAVAQLRGEGHEVGWTGCVLPGADPHAGRAETSVMLHLAPADVRMRKAAPGDTRPLPVLMPELIEKGVKAVSPNGVLGDPTGATGEEGAALLDAAVDTVTGAVRTWSPDRRGRLMPASGPTERGPAAGHVEHDPEPGHAEPGPAVTCAEQVHAAVRGERGRAAVRGERGRAG
jgi:mycofactocin precursor peptide peptidase